MIKKSTDFDGRKAGSHWVHSHQSNAIEFHLLNSLLVHGHSKCISAPCLEESSVWPCLYSICPQKVPPKLLLNMFATKMCSTISVHWEFQVKVWSLNVSYEKLQVLNHHNTDIIMVIMIHFYVPVNGHQICGGAGQSFDKKEDIFQLANIFSSTLWQKHAQFWTFHCIWGNTKFMWTFLKMDLCIFFLGNGHNMISVNPDLEILFF